MQQVEVRETNVARPFATPSSNGRVYLRPADRRILVGAGDILAILLALWVALAAMEQNPELAAFASASPVWLVTLVALWLVIAPAFDAYSPNRLGSPTSSAIAVFQAGIATAAAYFLTPYLSAPLLSSRAVMLVFAVSIVGLLVAWRMLSALALGRFAAPRAVLVVGTGSAASRTITEALAYGPPDFRLAGIVDDGPEGRAELPGAVESRRVTDVVVADPSRMHADLVKALIRVYESGVNVVPMASLYEQLTGRIPVEHVGDDWTGAMPQIERLSGLSPLAKRTVDLVAGAVGLAVFVALTPLLALAIRLDSRGPIFYSQPRVGYRGRVFDVWKFRSMVHGAEADGLPRWASPNDPRVTRVGRFLRRTRLDELPQVLNMLRGEMSLVGPRPERPAFVAELEQSIPFYRARLLVKPGLTGWAQVKYRYGSSADDALVKLQYDLYYVKHRSLLLDALIVVKTLPVVLRFSGR